MLKLRNALKASFFTFAPSAMVHSKPPPAPTVPTAIREKETLQPSEQGEFEVFEDKPPPLEYIS